VRGRWERDRQREGGEKEEGEREREREGGRDLHRSFRDSAPLAVRGCPSWSSSTLPARQTQSHSSRPWIECGSASPLRLHQRCACTFSGASSGARTRVRVKG